MIPKGKHRAFATKGEFGKSKHKGTDFVAVEFEIMGDSPHKGEHITWWGYFTEATQGRVVESLQHAGCTFPNDEITDLEGLGSTEVEIVVEHETYEGKTRAKVQWVNEMGGGGPQIVAMAPEAKSAFSSKLRGLVMMKKKTGDQARAAQASQAAASSQDDIPWR